MKGPDNFGIRCLFIQANDVCDSVKYFIQIGSHKSGV
jgi:hypothetical protein